MDEVYPNGMCRSELIRFAFTDLDSAHLRLSLATKSHAERERARRGSRGRDDGAVVLEYGRTRISRPKRTGECLLSFCFARFHFPVGSGENSCDTKSALLLCAALRDGLVAQLVEQCPFKALVQGSSPCQPTISSQAMAWVYILRGASGRHYIGSTNDLVRRLEAHRRGQTHTTARLGDALEVVAFQELASLS